MSIDTYNFLGVQFNPLTPAQTLEKAQIFTSSDEFAYLVTPNVDHLVRLTQAPEIFKPLYGSAWLTVCDSRILEILARFSKIPLIAVPGSDLTQQLFDTVITKDDSITIIGADAQIINIIKSLYGIENIHHYEPPFGMRHKPESIAQTAQFIAEHPARYVFICVGSPQQEMVAKAALERGDCTGLGLCVGASLEFLTGRVKRAPLWMQKIRLEWLHRLASEPRRLWKRYMIEGPKIFIIWAKWRVRRS